MRVTIEVDSATPYEAYDLTLALQRTAGFARPPQHNKGFDPQVKVTGSCMTWTSPYMYPVQVASFWREFETLTIERHRHNHDVESRMLNRLHDHTCLDGAHIECRRVLGLPVS